LLCYFSRGIGISKLRDPVLNRGLGLVAIHDGPSRLGLGYGRAFTRPAAGANIINL
jgi:hypothetical protein